MRLFLFLTESVEKFQIRFEENIFYLLAFMNTGPVLLIGILNKFKFTSYSPSTRSFGKVRLTKNSFFSISALKNYLSIKNIL